MTIAEVTLPFIYYWFVLCNQYWIVDYIDYFSGHISQPNLTNTHQII